VQQIEIYDSEASFHYTVRPPDLTSPQMDPNGSIEPMWGVHTWNPDRGRRMDIIPHALLEDTVVRCGHDPDDVEGIVSTILHTPFIPDPSDPLAYDDPAKVAVLEATADVPALLPGMPDAERLEVTHALVGAVRAHRATVDPASREDRQGALDWRAAMILDAGDQVPQDFQHDLGVQAPGHPLDALLSAVRLDPARIAARRARNDWMQARRERSVSRSTAVMGPRTFGFGRVIPQPQTPVEPPAVAAARARIAASGG
jgi:hypothetical protein